MFITLKWWLVWDVSNGMTRFLLEFKLHRFYFRRESLPLVWLALQKQEIRSTYLVKGYSWALTCYILWIFPCVYYAGVFVGVHWRKSGFNREGAYWLYSTWKKPSKLTWNFSSIYKSMQRVSLLWGDFFCDVFSPYQRRERGR